MQAGGLRAPWQGLSWRGLATARAAWQRGLAWTPNGASRPVGWLGDVTNPRDGKRD